MRPGIKAMVVPLQPYCGTLHVLTLSAKLQCKMTGCASGKFLLVCTIKNTHELCTGCIAGNFRIRV